MVEITLLLLQLGFTITIHQRRESSPGQQWEYIQDAQNAQSSLLSILSASQLVRRGYTLHT